MTKQTASPVPEPSAPLTIIAERFKTKLCRSWLQNRYCPYQSKCMFAHGEEERRTSAMNLEEGITSEEAIREFKRQQLKKRRQLAAAAVIPAPRSGIRRQVGSAASTVSAPAVLGGPTMAVAQDLDSRLFANPPHSFERSASSLPDPTQSPNAVNLQPMRTPALFFTPLPQAQPPTITTNGRTAIIAFPRRPSSIVEPPAGTTAGLGPMCGGLLDGSSNCSSANPSELWDVDDYPASQTVPPAIAEHHSQPPLTMMRRRSSDGAVGPLMYTPPNIYLSWEEPPTSGVVTNAGPTAAGPNASRTPSMTLGISATSDDASATSTSSKNVRYRHDPYGWSVDARSPDVDSSWT